MNVVIITGASSGMGRELAKQIDRIYTTGISEIWLVARRTDRLETLSMELEHKARILPLDLNDEKDRQELDLSLTLLNPNVRILVNASGYGIMGDFIHSKRKEQIGMIRLNAEALTYVTSTVLKYMKRGARIINFASSAAFVPQTGFSVYAATKSYVLSFSRSLNAELKPMNISVTAVCPGPVNTEFFEIAEKNSTGISFKKYFMVEAKDVVRKALVDSYNRRSLSIYSIWMQLFAFVTKIIPHDLLLTIMTKMK